MSRPPISRARPYTPRSGAFAGQTFTSERQYRDALARLKGYGSWYEKQRTPKKTTRRALGTLKTRERQARARALDALSLMRSRNLSLSAAAREAKTSPETVLRWAGSELREQGGGRYLVTTADRLVRSMRVISTDGVVEVEVRGSRQASLIGQHMNAVKQFLASGDDEALRRFEGVRVSGVLFETDAERIEERGRVHELSFEDIYSTTR